MGLVRGALPESVDGILETLGLGRYHACFKEHEFLPHDLFLATDGSAFPLAFSLSSDSRALLTHPIPSAALSDDFKDIGLPVGPRVKLRNWVRAQVAAA